MKKYFKRLIYISIVFSVFLIFFPAQADSPFQNGINDAATQTGQTSSNFFTKSNTNLPQAIGAFMKVFFVLVLGVAYFIWMIFAGITWMTARGNEEKIEKAKNTIKNATIGLIVALMAYTVTIFVWNIFNTVHK